MKGIASGHRDLTLSLAAVNTDDRSSASATPQFHGTRCFSSSNQFWTTTIRGAAPGLAGSLTMRKRRPSADTSSGTGTVFHVTADGTFDVIYAFPGSEEGTSPSTLLQAADGTIYGVAPQGGAFNRATVF